MLHTKLASLLTLFPLLALSPDAEAAAGKKLLELRYEVRVSGLKIGKARLTVFRGKKKGDKRIDRIRFKADVKPLGVAALKMGGDGTTWVTSDYAPVKARWAWSEMGRPAEVKAQWANGAFDGRYFRDGAERKRIKTKANQQQMTDVVTVLPWIMSEKPKAGQTLKTTTFTGNQLYNVTAKVGVAESVALPTGERKALRVEVTAVRPGKTRKFTVWVDATTFTPVRIGFKYRFLGTVDAVLVGERRRAG